MNSSATPDVIQSSSYYSPSPWDGLSTSGSPSSFPDSGLSENEPEISVAIPNELPRLVPEIEEGNVEYKLKLTNPTPERFTRLVTQLKWRLLAGSGQALYEIGVSDSGQLVGLSRKDLDDSLETLEQMAGELGATVIIQKEVTMPVPCAPIDRLKVDGAPRFARKPSPTEDWTASSTEESHGSDLDTPSTPDAVAVTLPSSYTAVTANLSVSGQASALPIIHNFPYGQQPRRKHHHHYHRYHHTSSLVSSFGPMPTASSEELDFDDDAAFAFDLDINSISLSQATKPLAATHTHAHPQHDHPPPPLPPLHQHQRSIKRTRYQQTHTPTDPALKAAQRRQRRDARREDRRTQLLFGGIDDFLSPSSSSPSLSSSSATSTPPVLALSPPHVMTGTVSVDLPSLLTALPPLAYSNATSRMMSGKGKKGGSGRGTMEGDVDPVFDPLAPRYIAEALVLRKVTLDPNEFEIYGRNGTRERDILDGLTLLEI